MRFKNSLFTLIVTLVVVFIFVVGINLMSSNHVVANGSNLPTPNQESFDPIRGDNESEERFDEEQDEDDEDEDDEEDEYDEEDDEDEEGDEEFGEFEELEFQRMELELGLVHIEKIKRLAEIAESDVGTASYAIIQLEESLEDEEDAEQLLKEMIASPKCSKPVKNLLKMKLAELYSWSDRPELAREVYKSMILGAN